jgi:hypothetical protein
MGELRQSLREVCSCGSLPDEAFVVAAEMADERSSKKALLKGFLDRTCITLRAFRLHLRVRGSSRTAQQCSCLCLRVR